MRCLLSAILAASVLLACSPSEPKPPETPEAPVASAEPAPEPTAEPKNDGPAPMPGQVVRNTDANSIPDDYSITAGDCDALGKQYGAVARSDQMSALSPKLGEKQRAATAASVDKVVSKLEESWIKGCQTSLVGKVADPKSLKCALSAGTVKAFDVCLNGEGGTPQDRGKAPKKK
jgi:hypothetical protein